MVRQRRWLMEPNKKVLKFRPQSMLGKYKIKHNPIGQYHWYEHRPCDQHVLRVGGYLHYLADHAPNPVRKKWKQAFQRFCKLHPKF